MESTTEVIEVCYICRKRTLNVNRSNVEQKTFQKLYPSLTEKDFRQLAFLAYYGETSPYSKPADEYRKLFGVSQKKYYDTIQKLKDEHILQTDSYVGREYQLEILICLYENYSSWIVNFKTISPFERSETARYLCRLAQCIINQDFQGARNLTRPNAGLGHDMFNLYGYVHRLAMRDSRFFAVFRDEEIEKMIHDVLLDKFFSDELDEELFEHLDAAIPPYLRSGRVMKDEIAAYRFFQTGEASGMSGKTMWSYGVSAIQLMSEGKYEGAYKKFMTAKSYIKSHNQTFPCPVFNYAYGILVYILKSRKESQEYLDRYYAFTMASAYRYKDENFAIRMLLEYIDKEPGDAKADVSKRVFYVMERMTGNGYKALAYIVRKFYGIEEDDEEIIPRMAFMQHEMSPWLAVGPDARQRLDEKFHGAPLISNIRKKESWEVMLSSLSTKLEKVSTSREQRIVYYAMNGSLQAVYLQQRQDDGNWQDKRLLSITRMSNGDYDFADYSDIIIANELTKQKDSHKPKDIDVLVPSLYGTGRLLYGDGTRGSGEEIGITKEEPYLRFEGKGEQIEITSNLSLDEDGNVPRHIVKKDGNDGYTLISTNVLQRDIVKRFIDTSHFPSTALGSLRHAIDSLKGIINIEDGKIAHTDVPARRTDGIMSVRIAQIDNGYDIQIQATAMPDGTERFPPAEDERNVYDEVNGLTHWVERDLDREYENYQTLDTLIASVIGAEVVQFAKYRISTEEGLLELLSFIHDHQDICFAEWPEGKALKFKGTVNSGDIDIQVYSDMEWFSVEGTVNVNGEQHSLEELVKACSGPTTENFVRIGEDEYVRMSEKLKKRIAELTNFGKTKNVRRVPKFLIGKLAQIITDMRCHPDEGYTSFMEKTRKAFDLKPDMPSDLHAELRPYQKEGFQWLCRLDAWGAGACLADEMGLGKTLQTLTFLLYKASEGPSLVVAPKSVVLNWVSEAMKFTPTLHLTLLNESKNRYKAIEDCGPNDIVLCTYGLLVTEGDYLTRKDWNVVCLDEAHQIKNHHTLSSNVAMELKAKSKVILTGTPLQNNMGELWNLFQFINPGLLGKWSVFRDNYVNPELNYERWDTLKDLTQPFILRRTKKEVLKDLPEKMIYTHLVDQTENEKKVYEEMRRQLEVKFKKHKTKAEREEAKELKLNFFAELMKLRLTCCSMRLVYPQWKEQSSKIEALLDMMENILSEKDNNVIVFSQFTSFLEMIKPELKRKDWDFLYLDGQTPMEKRNDIVADFQKGKCRIFLSSLKAGGLGINLTAANYVILLDPWWNPAIENQAMDRAHRIGQKREVTVIRMITSMTIEEKILRLHEKKQKLSEEILDGTGDSWQLTYEDILDMVSPF